MNDKVSAAYLLYLLLLSGYIFTHGFYSLESALILFIFFFLLILFFLRPKYEPDSKLKFQKIEQYTLLFSMILSLFLYGGVYQIFPYLSMLSIILIIIQILIFTVVKKSALVFNFGVTVAALLGIFMIISSPSPKIDVFVFLKEGASALIAGKNPYSQTYTQVYKNTIVDYYAYYPVMLLVTVPSIILFNDPRFSILLAIILAGILIKKQLKDDNIALIFLFNPIYPYLLEESYTEPIIFFLVLLFVYLLMKKKTILYIIVLSLLLGIKQYTILWLPFIFPLIKNLKKLLLLSLFSALIFLPFLLWSLNDFIRDAIFLQISYPARYEGLTLNSLIYNQFGLIIPSFISIGIWLGGIIFALLKINEKKHYVTLTARIFFFMFVFFFFNKWSFINYYYFLSSMWLLYMVLVKYESKI